MKTLTISISEIEFNKLGLRTETLTFSDFLELVKKELSKETLQKCVNMAGKFGLSVLTMEDISKEVKAIRKKSKGTKSETKNEGTRI